MDGDEFGHRGARAGAIGGILIGLAGIIAANDPDTGLYVMVASVPGGTILGEVAEQLAEKYAPERVYKPVKEFLIDYL